MLTSFFRSQDILKISYADYKALGTYLQIVARELRNSRKRNTTKNAKEGSLVCHTTSAFIYAKDRQKAIEVLRHLRGKSTVV